MIVKKKSKVTKTILAAAFFITIIAIASPVLSADPSRILKIDIMAKGDDADISGATTSIIAKIGFDKTSGIPSAVHVEFQTKIYESGEKIYSMKGKLKNGMVIPNQQFYCDVQEVWWINLLLVMGDGVIKTIGEDLIIEYRGLIITLPNTEGKYIPYSIRMMVNPKGQYRSGDLTTGPIGPIEEWDQGGWATVIIFDGDFPIVGVVTYLTKYIEKLVP